MSIQDVVAEWLEWGIDPDNIEFDIEDEREFCADIMQSDKDWLIDSFCEGFSRNPKDAAEFIEYFRTGDIVQMGAAADRLIRWYMVDKSAEYWLSEFTQVSEQNSVYQGDE